jgi:hypothetical protein
MSTPATRAKVLPPCPFKGKIIDGKLLSLSLLVLGIFRTNYPHDPTTLDHFAAVA